MAFVVRRRNGFEIRESRVTPAGPRASTLVTFQVLDDAVLRRASARSTAALDEAALRRRARDLGAPVAPPDVVLAARSLLVAIDRGHAPPRALRDRLVGALGSAPPASRPGTGDALDDALGWVDVTDEARGRALVDLLALTDALPVSRTGPLRFPRLVSRAG